MKKIFLFAVAAVAAMTVNAAVWDFKANPANTSALFDALNPVLTQATATEKQTGDSIPKPYIEVTNQTAAVEASVEFDHFPMTITYTNSKDANKKFFRIYGEYFQVDAKGTKLIFSCAVGDKISFFTKKYTKNLAFYVTGADKEVIEFLKNEEDHEVSVTATATEVVFDTKIPAEDEDRKSYDQSYQFRKISVGAEEQGIEDVKDAVKAVKFFENGQLVIIKNGVKYNALGAQL